MNREIKFKVFYKREQKMCELLEMHLSEGRIEKLLIGCKKGDNPCYVCVADVDFYRYLGKRDADGNEVYEKWGIK